MNRSRTPDEQPRRMSAVLARLHRLHPWNVLGGVIVFAMTFGLTTRIVAAAAFVAAYTAIQAAFGQRVRERFERQPDLRLSVADGGKFVNAVESNILPPWPFDADRIVANELDRLHEKASATEKYTREGPAAMLSRATDPFASRPRDQEYQQARERFTEKLTEYEQALREWLTQYGEAADARARTFELLLLVISARSGAYAEDVVLTVDLPEGVDVVDERPTVPPPPEAPTYVAPTPRSVLDVVRPSSFARLDLRPVVPDFSIVPRSDVSFWGASSDGRRISRPLGNIHHDSTRELDERLLLRVPADGRHELTWTLRTKNGRRHRAGTLELIVPSAEQRPQFTRLHGIESYPDVPFVDEDDNVVNDPRSSDPPTEPPPASSTDEVLGRLHDMAALGEWQALGIGDVDGRRNEAVTATAQSLTRPRAKATSLNRR